MDSSSSSAAAVSSAGTIQPDPAEIVSRPLLNTPFSDYTVSEGLLLMIFLTLLIGGVLRYFRG